MRTKAELMKAVRDGELQPIASHTLSNTGGIAICYMDDYSEKVFGYMAYGQKIKEMASKDFFFVKINTENSGRQFFKVGQLKIYLDECMRLF